jgi:hypothetical protein
MPCEAGHLGKIANRYANHDRTLWRCTGEQTKAFADERQFALISVNFAAKIIRIVMMKGVAFLPDR